MKMKSESEVPQSCPTLSDPMDCSLPGSCIHGIFQARVLEWGVIAFSDEKPRQHIKKNTHHFANKGPYGPHGQTYELFFFSVLIYGCESWTLRLSIKELMPSNCGVGEDS